MVKWRGRRQSTNIIDRRNNPRPSMGSIVKLTHNEFGKLTRKPPKVKKPYRTGGVF